MWRRAIAEGSSSSASLLAHELLATISPPPPPPPNSPRAPSTCKSPILERGTDQPMRGWSCRG